ncbi:MAG: asparagine synthase C-terminal domain-containing protein [Candidatus Nezhaarchaeota archaeon]|nr:asparagine synthase C-terminal domain-containing protein [Candidatus Nezhaarchaeota archaeon]
MNFECSKYINVIVEIVAREASKCEWTLLSGGVDTSFIVLVHPRREELKALTVDLGGPDVWYASMVARKLKIKSHTIVRPNVKEYLKAVDWVLENIRVIDPVEVSADVVHYIAMSRAKSMGCSSILSGDGGDELFVGYTFLCNKPESYVRSWIEERAISSWLPTVYIGQALGIRVQTPLYTDAVKEIVLKMPLKCLVDEGVGKVLLREALRMYGLVEVASRPKTPVNIGSGSQAMLKMLASKVSDNMVRLVEREMGFKPPSKVHAWLAYRFIELGLEAPGKVEGSTACSVCGRLMVKDYCRFCGAYTNLNGTVLHYMDD